METEIETEIKQTARERMNENQKRRGRTGFAALTLRFIGNNPFTQTKHHILHLKSSCFHMKDQLNQGVQKVRNNFRFLILSLGDNLCNS